MAAYLKDASPVRAPGPAPRMGASPTVTMVGEVTMNRVAAHQRGADDDGGGREHDHGRRGHPPGPAGHPPGHCCWRGAEVRVLRDVEAPAARSLVRERPREGLEDVLLAPADGRGARDRALAHRRHRRL